MRRLLVIVAICICGWTSGVTHAVASDEHLIAVVMANTQPRYPQIHAAFLENIASFCTDNCRVYVQTPNADTMSLRNSVRKAVAVGAEVILTYGPAATLAAKAEAPPVPTLFVDVYDPVKLKLVSPDGRSGKRMTGIRGDAPLQALLKYFLEATDANSLVLVHDPESPESIAQKETFEESAKRRGLAVTSIVIDDQEDIPGALSDMPEDTQGLYLVNSEQTGPYLEEILQVAAGRSIPVVTQLSGAAERGAFMVMESSVDEQGAKLAEMLGQVLSGTKVDQIPLYKPRNVSFIVNLNTAKACHLQVPFDVLTVASKVIR